MSFAGAAPRGSSSRGTSPNVSTRSGLRSLGTADAARASAEDAGRGELDWRQIGVFAAGIAIGAVVATGATLLLAPLSGEAAREAIARRGRRVGRHSRDAWDDLRDELAVAAFTGKRNLRRGLRHRRRALEELMDR